MALIEIDWKPGSRQLRQFAGLFLVFGLAAGAMMRTRGDWPSAAHLATWTVALIVGLGGLIVPGVARPAYVAMMAVAAPVGLVVSSVLLAALFFLAVTPIGLAMRAVGYDPMRRRDGRDGRDGRETTTYWKKRPSRRDIKRYLRQS